MKRKLFCLLSFLGLMLVGCGSTTEEEPIDSNPNTSVSDDNTNQDPTTDPDPSSEVEHTHSYEEGVYMSDENGHWQVCVDNDGTTDVVSHDYDNGEYVDIDNEENHVIYCSVCNYQLVQEHEFSGSYMDNDDGLNHYDLCVKCDYKLLEPHAYGDYTSGTTPGTHSAECSCGMVDIQVCTYDLSQYQYSDSTGHYRICDLYGCTIFESHNLVDCECDCGYSEHSYGEYSFDSSDHWQECIVCGNKTTITPHDDGALTNINDPDYHAIACTACDYPITQAVHTLENCECACGYSEHSYDGYSSDSSGHWQECTNCGNKTATSSHGRTLTNINDPDNHAYVCSTCDYIVRYEAHNFDEEGPMYHNESTHRIRCSRCFYTIYESHTSTNGCSKCEWEGPEGEDQ